MLLPFPCNCIVMNSTSLVRKTVPFLKVYDPVYAYLDNDSAGRRTVETIESAIKSNVIRASDGYPKNKDLNDYLKDK